MEKHLLQIFAIIFGVIVGSFLTVCIHRIPLSRNRCRTEGEEGDESTLKTLAPDESDVIRSFSDPTRSICPDCGQQLLWWHNIPLISWIALRGKCAFCNVPISARYPLVEVMTAGVAFLSLTEFGLSLTALLVFCFCAALIVISFIDYDYYIIPNVISYPGMVLGFVVGAVNQSYPIFGAPVTTGILDSFLGFLAGAGFLFFVSEVYLRLRRKEGLGMGDVKLLGMTGAFFGVPGAAITIFLGSLLGSFIGFGMILLRGRKMSQQLPFGPYLALGTFLYIFIDEKKLNVVALLIDHLVKH